MDVFSPVLQHLGQPAARFLKKERQLAAHILQPGLRTAGLAPLAQDTFQVRQAYTAPHYIGKPRFSASEPSRYNKPPTQRQLELFQKLDQAFVDVQEMALNNPEREAAVEKLKTQWDRLRQKAGNGSVGALKVLQGLWLNRMIEEIEDPGPHLVRFDYEGFDERVADYHSGKLSRRALNNWLQINALTGIDQFYAFKSAFGKNPLVEDRERLFKPVFTVLKHNMHKEVQLGANILLPRLFQHFTTAQQGLYLNWMLKRFQESRRTVQKFSILQAFDSLYRQSPKLPFWQEKLIPQLQKNLDTFIHTGGVRQMPEEDKYWIILAALVQDKALTGRLEQLLDSGIRLSKNTQRAIAWSLGNVKTVKAMRMLIGMTENPKHHPLAREMAVYSLAEYAPTAKTLVKQKLKALADQSTSEELKASHRPKAEVLEAEPNDVVIVAARSMQESMKKRSYSIRDYFIDRFLQSSKDRDAYRKMRREYMGPLNRLTIVQKNIVDRSLIPYAHHLPQIVRRGGKYTFTKKKDVVIKTPENRHLAGIRGDDGRLWDNVSGVSDGKNGAVSSISDLKLGRQNVFAHEFMHQIHQLVLDKQEGMPERLKRMYNQAVRDNRTLNYYAATDEYEYLAEGGEAYDALYKKHLSLYPAMFNDGYDTGDDNIRSKLKRKDPPLYSFIRNLQSIHIDPRK